MNYIVANGREVLDAGAYSTTGEAIQAMGESLLEPAARLYVQLHGVGVIGAASTADAAIPAAGPRGRMALQAVVRKIGNTWMVLDVDRRGTGVVAKICQNETEANDEAQRRNLTFAREGRLLMMVIS